MLLLELDKEDGTARDRRRATTNRNLSANLSIDALSAWAHLAAVFTGQPLCSSNSRSEALCRLPPSLTRVI